MTVEEFVQRNVYCIANDIAEAIFCEDSVHSYEDIENNEGRTCPHCSAELDNVAFENEHCPECHKDFEQSDCDYYGKIIYQWFLVSIDLGEMLIEHGESVLMLDGCALWGRDCCGLAIYQQAVVVRIYNEIFNNDNE